MPQRAEIFWEVLEWIERKSSSTGIKIRTEKHPPSGGGWLQDPVVNICVCQQGTNEEIRFEVFLFPLLKNAIAS